MRVDKVERGEFTALQSTPVFNYPITNSIPVSVAA